MAHEVESMIFKGETPWHGLGTKVEAIRDFDEAMRLAGIDWTVSKQDLFTNTQSELTSVIDWRLIVRDTDGAQLGMVGKDYSPIQNCEAFRPTFEALVGSDQVTLETAGSLRGGRKVWMLFRINDGVADVLPGDAVRAYLLVVTSHDGSIAHCTQFTATRVVCANTLAAALGTKGEGKLKVYHTGAAVKAVDEVAKLINVSKQTFEATVETYRRLAAMPFSKESLEKYVRLVFEIPAPKDGEPETSRLLPKIVELAETGIGMNLPGVQGTMWAAYNAVTEHLTHHKGNSQEVRMDTLAFGSGNALNQRALQLALVA